MGNPAKSLSSAVIALAFLCAQGAHAGGKVGTWTKKASLPVAVDEIGVAAVDGKIYVVGGATQRQGQSQPVPASTSNLMYDPASDRWEERAPLPHGMDHVGVAELGGKLYAVGGFSNIVHMEPQALAFVYDPRKNQWSELPKLSAPRGSAAVAAVGGKIHVFGGRDSSKVVKMAPPGAPEMSLGIGTLTTHEIYDPASGKWSQGKPLPAPPRDHMGIAVLDGKVHLFGGRINDFSDLLDRHDVYDPKTDTWTSAAPLPHPRSAGAYTLLNGLIIYAGGECKPGGQPGSPDVFDEVTAYDSKSNSWATLTPMPQGRQAFGAAAVGGVGYFVGGAPVCGGGASADVNSLTVR